MKPGFRLELTTPDGETLELHNPPERVVWGMTGWGLSPRQTLSTKGPAQTGSSVLGTNAQERELSFTLFHNGCNKSAYYNNRLTYVDYFRENRDPIFLPQPWVLTLHYFQNGSIVSRSLEVFFNDGFVFQPEPEGQWREYQIQEQLVFTAHNPIVYDPTQLSSTITISEELILPMTFPFILGGFHGYNTITYAGTWEEFPTIEVGGPAKNFSIWNKSTDKRINYEGRVAGNETITFDLSYDSKTVTDSCGNNVIGNVSGDLGTFNLECDPILSAGENEIWFYSEIYDSGSTFITIKYYNRYRGI